MPSTSIEERFRLAQIAIGNAQADPALLEVLAEYSYNATRLQQGNALREQAWALYQRQKSEYGELSAAGAALKAAQQQACTTHTRYAKVARVALKAELGALHKLDVTAGSKRPRAKWLAQAQQFYTQALSNADILDRLTEFGITQAMLEAGQRQVDAVGEVEAVWRQHRGAARDATSRRDELIATLDEWMRDFTDIARVAFENRPKLLEKLGMKTRGTRAAARTRNPATGSEVAFDAEVSTPAQDSAPPAPYRHNGRATATSR